MGFCVAYVCGVPSGEYVDEGNERYGFVLVAVEIGHTPDK